MHKEKFVCIVMYLQAQVVAQLLRSKEVAQVDVWGPIVTRLAVEAAYTVDPALIAHGVPDPTHYIKVTPHPSCISSARQSTEG